MKNQRGIATIWIVVAVAAVLIVGGSAFYLTNNSEGENQQTETQTQEEATDGQSLLESALAGNASIECNYTHDDGSSGVAYLQKNGDFRVEQTTDEGEVRMIKTGDSAYIWTVGQAEGFVMDGSAWEAEYRDNFAVFSPDEFEREAEGVNDIDCERRSSFDNSLFTAPENVQFNDLSELQNIGQ